MESDNMKKALIAMSGGVDSSVAAYLMKEHGYDCIGVTMKLFQNEDAGVSRKKSCCSLDDVEDARSVAHNLGMPYYVFNFTADFKKQVMDRFVAAYENGATPNPCIDCNRYLKFNSLYHRAEELGCHYVVTGHYARIEKREDGRYLLKKAMLWICWKVMILRSKTPSLIHIMQNQNLVKLNLTVHWNYRKI